MDIGNLIRQIAIYAIPVLFAITVHEAAHGFVARYFGDHTAEREGRLSLNPLRHIDPLGTIVVPLLAQLFGGFLFGWAKPVPVNFDNLRQPKANMLWVAAAGPASNLLMAIVWGAILVSLAGTELLPAMGAVRSGVDSWLPNVAYAGVSVNVSLMLLNLLPLPPLDGGRILVSLLPDRAAEAVSKIEPYGFFILLALIYSKVLITIMLPAFLFTYQALNMLL